MFMKEYLLIVSLYSFSLKNGGKASNIASTFGLTSSSFEAPPPPAPSLGNAAVIVFNNSLNSFNLNVISALPCKPKT